MSMEQLAADPIEGMPRKISPIIPFVIAVVMFGAAFWAGGQIANGEIAALKLDDRTAQGHIVRVKSYVPAGAIISPTSIEEVQDYANRIEPFFINSAASVAGKKSKYGLEAGQIVTVKDMQ